jgi:hypothetical protein
MVSASADHAPQHVCTYGEEHPGLFMRSDATQIQRHVHRIFLEIRTHQVVDPHVTIDMSSRINSAVARPRPLLAASSECAAFAGAG